MPFEASTAAPTPSGNRPHTPAELWDAAKKQMRKQFWSPFVTGTGIGAVEAFAFATADHPLGITTTFEDAAAVALRTVAPRHYKRYVQARGEHPTLDWQAALVAGTALGSYVSSKASADRFHPAVPHAWAERFGSSRAKRYAAAFVGGALMMFGARMARGCTSGHSISGLLGFAGSSGLFSLVMGASAAATARALFGKERR